MDQVHSNRAFILSVVLGPIQPIAMADWQKTLFNLSDVRVLFYLHDNPAARYNELLSKVIESRSTLAASLSQLLKEGLVIREVKDTRPLQTRYSLTEKGKKFVGLLLEMKRLLEA
jgi:DNA-binding HxlR family transcriptional regulator